MKKFFVILFLLLMLPAYAVNWKQVGDKTWFDLSSWQREGDIVTGWFKDLNPGHWKPINNKKVWYTMSLYSAKCNKREIGIKTLIFYDLKGQIIEDYMDSSYIMVNYYDVIPGTNGEWKYDILCDMGSVKYY